MRLRLVDQVRLVEVKVPINFRPIRSRDESFLYRVFVSTRSDITLLNITDDEKTKLLRTQFKAQSFHYHTHFGDADFLIVLRGNEPIGRLYVHRRVDEIRVIDIALLPEHREHGIGTQLMLDILKEGQIADKPVRIHVEKMNRAIRFYERFGFVRIGDIQSHYLMEWRPGNQGSYRKTDAS